MTELIYLDHNSTTPTHPAVMEAMLPFFSDLYGNPSSVYKLARKSREAMDEARKSVANLLGASPEEIIFTSGGTESDNLAIKGVAYAAREKGNHIITSQIEHHAVLNCCKALEKDGFEVSYIGVDKFGIIDLDELKEAVKDDTILITIMHANNETGVIEPLQDIAKIAREKGVPLHTDAIQTVGKMPVDVNDPGLDLLSLSGHKIYGPKGIGALYLRKGTKIARLVDGGHHEKNRRPGTENVPGIVGLGKACEIATQKEQGGEAEMKRLRDKLQQGIVEKVPDVIINGHPEKRLTNTINLCVKFVEGESILLHLDAMGIAASSGSACTSDSLEASHVLKAMGVPVEVAHGSIRFSLGRDNTEEEIDRVLEVFPGIVEKLRTMSPLR